MMNPFKQFNKSMLPLLDKMWNIVSKLDNMRGDEFITIKRSGAGTTIGMDLQKVRQRVSRKQGEGTGGTSVRRARCAEDAGAGSTIIADLYNESTGVLAISGVEYNVTIYCDIANGSDLDEALPRLEEGLGIPVYEVVFDNLGTPETRWYYDGNFQASENCTCGT